MNNFTKGPIFWPITKFVFPVFVSLTLQFLYGAIDLWIVGQFAGAGDISGVAVGSMITQTVTSIFTGLGIGITVTIGRQIGAGKPKDASRTAGNGILLFGALSLILTLFLLNFSRDIIRLTGAPAEAFSQAESYVRICSAGTVFIAAYNFLGSALKGAGDSRTPMISVITASFFNFIGDYFFVAVFHRGSAGAAAATVLAQAMSVILTLLFLKKRGACITVCRDDLRFKKECTLQVLFLGVPVALQNLLLNFSFLINRSFVNALGLYASSGVGIAAKLGYIIMLVSDSYMQGVSTFTAQNIGANQPRRARKALLYASAASFAVAAIMFYPNFFHGRLLTSLFTHNEQISDAAAAYFRGGAIDSLLTAFSFCLIGYFNGCGMTRYVLFQSLVAAFCIRTPIAYYFSHQPNPQLFYISLGSPCASAVQLLMHLCAFSWQLWAEKKQNLESPIINI